MGETSHLGGGGGSLSPNVIPTGGANHTGGILGGMNSVAPSAPSQAVMNDNSGKRAKVLYDYDAADMSELSLVADEVGGYRRLIAADV